MGLLLKLENGDTALKSLKFGRDRLGNGSSNQPYIKNPIIDEPGKLSQADNDFLFRNGIKAPINAAEDVTRLTKYMFDFKSPSGLLFGIKQNLLSRIAPKTEATKGAAYAGGALNEGVYTPLSTILQAGIGFLGTHLNKQGIDPFGFSDALSIKKYEDVIKNQDENRLETLLNLTNENRSQDNFNFIKGYSLNVGNALITYGGGPGSILGIGKTRIRFADQRTGDNNALAKNTETSKYFYDGGLTRPQTTIDYYNTLGASTKLGLTGAQLGLSLDGQITRRVFSPITISPSGSTNPTLTFYTPSGETLSGYGFGGPNNVINPNTSAFTGDSDEFYQGIYNNYLTGIKNSPTDRSKLYIANVDANRKPLSYSDKVNYRYLLGASNFQGLSGNTNYLNLEGQFISVDGEVRFFGPHLPNYTLSKYNPTGLELTGEGGYSVGKQNHFTEITDTTYRSIIQEKLKEYGRELLSDSAFDTGGISGNANVWAPTSNTNREVGADSGKFIAKYSSRNSLIVDPRIISGSNEYDADSRKDINKATLINDPNSVGYLANLNKNSGIYEDPKNPGNYVTQHNPNRVGGRGIAADFRAVNRNKRGFFDPSENQAYDYITGVSNYEGKTIDRIYYNNSTTKRTSKPSNNGVDLIDFKINVINPTTPSVTMDLRFRAYIDNLSDSYNADWKSQTYMGRGEKFWKYNSFDRDMSLGFTVVADSELNLNSMYTDLNKLAASLAPTYTSQGYMAGNLHQLTIGNYISNQYGIVTSFTYDIMDESPWEIMPSVQLPFYIKVTGFKFVPIHNFRPSSFFNNQDPGYGKFIG
jgi:hypothetical protein